MRTLGTRAALAVALAALVLATGACGYLKDAEPFTQTIVYEDGPDGTLVVTPLEFEADAAFGEAQIVNNSQQKHGFAIRDLAVFLEIPAKQSRTARIQEAKDGRVYVFYCHLDGHENEIRGQMIVHYLAEEER